MDQRGGGKRHAAREIGRLGLGVLLVILSFGRAIAAETEVREFHVRIDGKPAGAYHMTIRDQGDQTISMTGQADVHATFFKVVRYVYTYLGTETWKGQRLLRLESTTNDNGTPLAVSAAAEEGHLRIQANHTERLSPPDIWTSTYWRLPDARYRNGAVTLLDADTGRSINATLQYLEQTNVNVAGQAVACAHYRVTGPKLHVDLWYDAAERLVRQDYVEDGHRTILELVRIGK
jgi:hypothetical protein